MSVVRETYFSANPPDTVLCAVVSLWYEKQQKLSADFVRMWEERTNRVELAAANFKDGALLLAVEEDKPGFNMYSTTTTLGQLS